MSVIQHDSDATLEIMEFMVGSNAYGINIAKVREVVPFKEPTPSPDQHPCVEGILMLREQPIPIINLSMRLKREESSNPERDLFIITTFNNLVVGLHVHKINGIRKMNWKDINKPDETISRHSNCITTGIINQPNQIVMLLDFEKIVADINPTTTIQISDVQTSVDATISDKPIMIVDDSPMLNNLIRLSLEKAGYENIISATNGQEAWDYLQNIDQKENPREAINCIITDIEMPVMDGHTLCRKIKDDPFLRKIPVILFSSIIEEGTRVKGEKAGADAQLSKPQINNLVKTIQEFQ